MKKGKRKKPEARRRGSNSQNGSSESTSASTPQQQPSPASAPQQITPGPTPQQPSSAPAPQQPSSAPAPQPTPSASTSQQPSSGSTPQPPESQALPSPGSSQSARGLLGQKPGTKSSHGAKKTGGQAVSSTGLDSLLLGSQGDPRSRFLLSSDARLMCIRELCLWSVRVLALSLPKRPGGLGFVMPRHAESHGKGQSHVDMNT